jgi:hypothetical protein
LLSNLIFFSSIIISEWKKPLTNTSRLARGEPYGLMSLRDPGVHTSILAGGILNKDHILNRGALTATTSVEIRADGADLACLKEVKRGCCGDSSSSDEKRDDSGELHFDSCLVWKR